MKNFKISTRLLTLVGMMSALLIAIGLTGLYGISRANDGLKSVYEDRTVALGQLGEARRLLERNRLELMIGALYQRPEITKPAIGRIGQNLTALKKVLGEYMATNQDAKEAELAKRFESDLAKYEQQGFQLVLSTLEVNDIESFKRVAATQETPLWEFVRKGIDALNQLQLDEAKAEYSAAVARYKTIQMVSVSAIVTGLVFAVWVGLALVKGISRSLGIAIEAAGAVAEGNLTKPVPIDGKDEVTLLLRSLSEMQSGLVQVVNRVRDGSEALSTASAEIAQGNQDLSARTESQASALQQTAASMEQLSATVKQNAENASQANHLAQSASAVASKGGQVVVQVVDTMREISESSKKISDIITVIDGIAFQTNILALNAAVEAARAGEQGRGFAVVAAEVRSLAGRSANAAKEIKSLINASVERVEQGTALVDEAGTTMQKVVSSIRRVTDIVAEISTASSEQSAGVSQVGEAVSQMDQVTQQNAALVEQMAAAAASLRTQAGDLVDVVSVFKLEQEAFAIA